VSLVLAVTFLGESMTPLRLLGIALVFLGPIVIVRTRKTRGRPRSVEAARAAFRPRFVRGYTYAGLCAVGFGTTPALLRAALDGAGPLGSIAGGLVSYAAATVVVALLWLWPGLAAHALSVGRTSARWFTISGCFVCISQMFRYMALSVAPVSVVAPLAQTASVFRIIFSRMLNREHEAFDVWVVVGIFISLVGGLALTLSVDFVLSVLTLPEAVANLLRWRWP
jgi:drug/metabolite transporter (DMT)-like permease